MKYPLTDNKTKQQTTVIFKAGVFYRCKTDVFGHFTVGKIYLCFKNTGDDTTFLVMNNGTSHRTRGLLSTFEEV